MTDMQSSERSEKNSGALALLAPVAGIIYFAIYAIPYTIAGKAFSESTAELALMILPCTVASALVLMAARRVNPVALACLGAISIYLFGFIYFLMAPIVSSLNSGFIAAFENCIIYVVPTVVIYIFAVSVYSIAIVTINFRSGRRTRPK